MKEQLEEALRGAVVALLCDAGDTEPPPAFALDAPRQAEHGDLACNAAMLLAKRLRRPPREIAERLIDVLGDAGGLVARAEVAGPGFVNLFIVQSRWRSGLVDILRAGADFGSSKQGAGTRVQVEFVSANPTGPLTLGHGRQGVIGDCIARLLEATGLEVTREYYFNDGGRQMRVLGQSVRSRYLEQLGRAAPPPREAFAAAESDWPSEIDGLPVVFPRDGYQGDYISEIATDFRAQNGDAVVGDGPDAHEPFREFAQQRIFEEIRRTLSTVRMSFDVYFNETSLYEEGRIDATVAALRDRGLVYDADGAVWLRATELGIDRDRVIVKSTGEPTYLLPDIAYHCEKFRRGFDLVIDVLGADHIEQFPSVRAATGALGCDVDRLELVMHQFVTLSSGGEQMKQSTRRANYVTIDDLVAEVGVDVFRFFMVQRKADGQLDFDLELARDRDWKKNPAYYVQYAHARTCAIERKAGTQGVERVALDAFDPTPLVLDEEIAIVRKLLEFPDLVSEAARAREPHHVAYYLRDLAGLWNPYLQDGTRHRIVSDDAPLSQARLGLAAAVRTVLARGLDLLGLSAPEQM